MVGLTPVNDAMAEVMMEEFELTGRRMSESRERITSPMRRGVERGERTGAGARLTMRAEVMSLRERGTGVAGGVGYEGG